MTELERTKWEKIRRVGLVRYVVVEGILKRGLALGALVALLPFQFGRYTGAFRMKWWELIGASFVLGLLFGAVIGALFWHLQERAYQHDGESQTS